MKPIDYRNTTFAELQGRIYGMREKVLLAWKAHGPCTTQELAERSEISILTLRPRTTDLFQLGFVICEGGTCGSGVYRAAAPAEVQQFFREQVAKATAGLQGDLGELGLAVPRHSSDRGRRAYC